MNPKYGTFEVKASGRSALNPRRLLHVKRLVEHVAWRGGKVWFNGETYGRLLDEQKLEPFQVDSAANDAYELGLIDIHLGGGDAVLTLLSADVEQAVANAIPIKQPAPRRRARI